LNEWVHESIECSGAGTEPYTDAQFEAVAQLVAAASKAYLHDQEMGDFGEPYPVMGTSRLAIVFTQVLPARMTCRDVEIKIAADPVEPNWRDEFRGQLARGAETPPERPRQPGRPAWTRDLFWRRYREARSRTDPPQTQASIAAHFEMLNGDMGTEQDYLRKLVQRFGLPPA
jgi:hypothetical protein